MINVCRLIVLVGLISTGVAAAWTTGVTKLTILPNLSRFGRSFYRTGSSTVLPAAADPSNVEGATEQLRTAPAVIEFSKDELENIERLMNLEHDDTALLEALSNNSPKLIVKLRQSENSYIDSVRRVAIKLNSVLDARLAQAKETLQDFLNAGEIRKLDALIGRAARAGNLDVAFFNVLTMNLQDAARNENVFVDSGVAAGDDNAVEKGRVNDGSKPSGVSTVSDPAASRLQILQHIYTRCQEEVEKSIPPAMALLNKLLRTTQAPIRRNLYQHYLTPQPNTITTPDGKIVELAGTQPVLVALTDFIDAIAKAVRQIRTVENAGGTDRESAANMVEACRTIAKEARIIIGEHYGTTSEELKTFEMGLQPVFRPSSPESPYIIGQKNFSEDSRK